MTFHSFHRSLAGIVITISIAAPVRAADPARDTPPDTVAPLVSATRSPQADIEDDEPVLDPAEPDVVVVNLPTTMRFPARGINFRLTHRFVGDLRRGSFGENAANLFGLDQGAIIGLEFRMGLTRNLQAAAFRTNFDRTIQLYGKYDAIRQGEGAPVGISAIVSVEGTDNFQEDYDRFMADVGAIVMGSTTYEYIISEGTEMWAYGATPVWVLTSRRMPAVPGADIRFFAGDIAEVHRDALAAAAGKNVWVVGGGNVAAQFADAGLLDELLLTIMPVVLGSGKPLLPIATVTEPLTLLDSTPFSAGAMGLRYRLTPELPQ